MSSLEETNAKHFAIWVVKEKKEQEQHREWVRTAMPGELIAWFREWDRATWLEIKKLEQWVTTSQMLTALELYDAVAVVVKYRAHVLQLPPMAHAIGNALDLVIAVRYRFLGISDSYRSELANYLDLVGRF